MYFPLSEAMEYLNFGRVDAWMKFFEQNRKGPSFDQLALIAACDVEIDLFNLWTIFIR